MVLDAILTNVLADAELGWHVTHRFKYGDSVSVLDNSDYCAVPEKQSGVTLWDTLVYTCNAKLRRLGQSTGSLAVGLLGLAASE